jgi:hypothetical protein
MILLRRKPMIYGVRWDSSDLPTGDTYQSTVVHRKVPVSQAFSRFPVQEGMCRCVLAHNTGALAYLLDPADSTKKLNGDNAALDGSDGQVMVRVPKFHRIIKNDGDYHRYYLISREPFTLYRPVTDDYVDSDVHPWFLEGGLSTPDPYKYVGAFEGVLKRSASYLDGTGSQAWASGDAVHSIYGYLPVTYFRLYEFRSAMADGAYHQYCYYADEAVMLLYLTEYKSWDSQGLLPGYTSGGSWDLDKRCKTGVTAELGNASGSIAWDDADSNLRCSTDQGTVVVANSFRGIENFYGHLWKWVDGINIQFIGSPLTDADVYVCNDPADFLHDTTTDYTSLGIDLPLASGYQRNLHDGTLLPSVASGASSTSYLRDYYYASSGAGWRALLSGGALVFGANAGVAFRYAYAASIRYASLGGRVAA